MREKPAIDVEAGVAGMLSPLLDEKRTAFRSTAYTRWSLVASVFIPVVVIDGVISILTIDNPKGSIWVGLAIVAANGIGGGLVGYRIGGSRRDPDGSGREAIEQIAVEPER
jgi:hypothetical protein